MNPSFGYFVGHKSNAGARTWEHHCVTMRDRRPVLCFFLQNTRAQTADSIHYHDVVCTLGHFLQLSGPDKLSPPPKGLFLSTSGHFLKTEWWSVWDSEMKSRSVMYNTRPVPWDEIGLSFQRVNAFLQLCPLPHVRHLLSLTPSGNSPNTPLLLPTIGIYAIWSPYCSDIYIGAVGQTAVRIQKRRFRRFLKSLGRKPIERWRDHALKTLRALSSKPGSKVCKMYNFMKRLGVESWVMTPIEKCYAKDLFRIENLYIKHTKRPLNNRLPTNSIKQWKRLGQLKMYAGMVTHSGIRGMVCDVLSSLRSPLSLPQQMSLLHVSQQKIESSLWRLLFARTASRVKRETGIMLKQFVMVRSPLPDPNFQASLRSTVAAALENSNGFQPLRQFYAHRVQKGPQPLVNYCVRRLSTSPQVP